MTDLPIVEFAFPGPLRDTLVAAVLSGRKTSTTSLEAEYGEDPLPETGRREAVVDSNGTVVCVIETTGVVITPLRDVPLEHALDEGEGYTSVEEWRRGHEKFWHSAQARTELGDPNFTVTDSTMVVLERFRLV